MTHDRKRKCMVCFFLVGLSLMLEQKKKFSFYLITIQQTTENAKGMLIHINPLDVREHTFVYFVTLVPFYHIFRVFPCIVSKSEQLHGRISFCFIYLRTQRNGPPISNTKILFLLFFFISICMQRCMTMSFTIVPPPRMKNQCT